MADVPSLPRCPADHPIFEPAVLDALGDGAIAFQQAQPFRHAVIDGLFRPEFLREVERGFYPVDDAR